VREGGRILVSDRTVRIDGRRAARRAVLCGPPSRTRSGRPAAPAGAPPKPEANLRDRRHGREARIDRAGDAYAMTA